MGGGWGCRLPWNWPKNSICYIFKEQIYQKINNKKKSLFMPLTNLDGSCLRASIENHEERLAYCLVLKEIGVSSQSRENHNAGFFHPCFKNDLLLQTWPNAHDIKSTWKVISRETAFYKKNHLPPFSLFESPPRRLHSPPSLPPTKMNKAASLKQTHNS